MCVRDDGPELLESARFQLRGRPPLELSEAAAYEPAFPGGEHHHHVVCDRCGKVSAFEDEALERAIDRLAGRLEYDVGGHDVVLRGACASCRE